MAVLPQRLWVKATGDPAAGAVAHHRHVNDFRHFTGEDSREMAVVTRRFLVGKQRDHAAIGAKFEIAPDQSSAEWRAENRLGIVALAGRDRFHLVTFLVRPIAGFVDATEAAVPNDDAIARMPRGNETVDDGVHNVAMSGKQFAAGRGNLDADLVVRRNERAPGTGQIGLAGHGEDEAIDHSANNRGIRPVLLDGRWIVRGINDRLRRNHLRDGGRGSAEQKTG
jgi:hypothetical protein